MQEIKSELNKLKTELIKKRKEYDGKPDIADGIALDIKKIDEYLQGMVDADKYLKLVNDARSALSGVIKLNPPKFDTGEMHSALGLLSFETLQIENNKGLFINEVTSFVKDKKQLLEVRQ